MATNRKPLSELGCLRLPRLGRTTVKSAPPEATRSRSQASSGISAETNLLRVGDSVQNNTGPVSAQGNPTCRTVVPNSESTLERRVGTAI